MRVLRPLVLCVAMLIASISSAYAQQSYTATLLPADFKFRNNNGDRLSATESFVVRSNDDWDLHSTLTITDRNGVVVSQYTSPNHIKDAAEAFSDSGIVVGTRVHHILVKSPDYFPAQTHKHAFVLANGVFTNLNDVLHSAFGTEQARVFESAARGVNNAGEVVGDFRTPAGKFGFLFRNGTVVNLGPLGSTVIPGAVAINNFGQVTGTKDGHAFIYSDGVFRDLGVLDASTPESMGLDINDAGHVVGSSSVRHSSGGTPPNKFPNAFLYQGGAMVDIGAFGHNSTARAISSGDIVVGHFVDTSSNAFVYHGGAITDLNVLVRDNNVGKLHDAIAINDDGVIVAKAGSNFVLLTPTPPPAVDGAVFSFEGNTQGWHSNGEPIINPLKARSQKFAGESSLGLLPTDSGFASVRVLHPSAHAGHTIIFRVYISSDAHIDWVQPFAQEGAAGNWRWHGNWMPAEALQVGTWNTITVNIPSGATPLQSIGFEFFASQRGGGVFLDSVDYGVTLDTAQYNFEGGTLGATQGWQSGGSFASVSASTAQKFAGRSSLALTLDNATFASARVAEAVGAGKTLTFRVYLPADAPINWIQPYAQEGAAANWNWHGSWTPVEGLQLGAWNTITVDVPADAQAVQYVGLELSMSQPYDGTVYVDSVSF